MNNSSLYAYSAGKSFNVLQPTVVFIHGAQHDHSVWTLQSRWFAHHGYNVLAFDRSGHGRSQGEAATSVKTMAQQLWTALNSRNIAQAHLIGHSLGSLIALEMAGTAPERVLSLSLLGTAYPMKVSDTLLEATKSDPATALDMINAWSHSKAWGGFSQKPQIMGPGSLSMWTNLRLMQRIAAKNGLHVLHADFFACNAYADADSVIKALSCPTLIMNGDQDSMTPPKAAKVLAEKIPGAKLVILPNCGHALMAEQPDRVLKALITHIKQTETTRFPMNSF